MRILILQRPSPPTGADGLNRMLEQTVACLRALSVQVDVVTDPDTDPMPYDLVHLYCLPDAALALRGLLKARAHLKPVVVTPMYWNLSRMETEGRALMQEWAPELVDTSAEGVDMRALNQEIECVTRQVEHAMLELVYRGADLLLPTSQMEAAQIERDFGVPLEAQRVVYNGVDPLFAQAAPEPFIEKYGVRDFVLCVGRIDPRKNQYTLLRALENEPLPIVLIGGSTAPEYVAACRRVGGSKTYFLSHFTPLQVAQAAAAAHVHALLTWGEVSSGAALEAGLAGCNLVMTTDSSGREYFGDYAWHVDPGDRRAIREAVLDAYRAPRGRAREWIRSRYTWERTAQAVHAAYLDVLHLEWRPFDVSNALASLAAAQAKLTALQGRQIENLWRAKVASEEYARRLAQGRVLRALNRLNHWLKGTR